MEIIRQQLPRPTILSEGARHLVNDLGYCPSMLNKNFASVGCVHFIAREGRRHLGILTYKETPFYTGVNLIYVRPQYRSKGIASALIRALNSSDVNRPIDYFVLNSNGPMSALMKKWGFKPDATVYSQYA